MFDFTVQLLRNNKLIDVNFADHIKNKKILICPHINFHSQPSFEYFKYIDSLLDTHSLDEVLIINSTKDTFFHKLVESMFPRLTSVGDSSQNYIKTIKKMKNNSMPIDKLRKRWIFQHALYDGKSIGFWEQPLSDIWHHLMKNKGALQKIAKRGLWNMKILKKMYKNQQFTANIWEATCLNFISKSLDGYGLVYNMGPEFFYFVLYQNNELETILNNINTSTK